jgi:DNA gyrase subunit B
VHWFTKHAALADFVRQQSDEGGEVIIDSADTESNEKDGSEKDGSEKDGSEKDDSEKQTRRARITELYEVRAINIALKELADSGFGIESLMTQDRTGSDKPRYVLQSDNNSIAMENLRELLPAIRTAGEKGLQVTRFKGLGEMNAEELRETTLDPAKRRLVRVIMPDDRVASELFQRLMGDQVEPRREYIEKHALDVQNLDV